MVQKIYILRAAETVCVDLHPSRSTPFPVPRSPASRFSGLSGYSSVLYLYCRLGGFPLPTHPRLPRLTTALGVELMPIPLLFKTPKVEPRSHSYPLLFFSSLHSLPFPLPVHLVYPRCISPSDYSRVVLPFLPLYRFRLLTSQPWLPE